MVRSGGAGSRARTARPSGAAATGALLLAVVWLGACAVPTARPNPSPGVTWAWSGAVTASSAVVKAKVPPTGEVRLTLAPEFQPVNPTRIATATVTAADASGRVVAFDVAGLAPATGYQYAVELDGAAVAGLEGRFRTFPAGAADVTIAFASCAQTGSSHPVFDRIAGEAPDLFIHMGDLHYEDIRRDDVARFRAAYDRVLTAPAQSRLYRSVPVAYVWDDHDFGGNNSTGDSPSRPAAHQAYREIVPHYPLGGAEAPIYQAFTIGRLRVLLTDTRSDRARDGSTMLGAEQVAWLKRELAAGRDANALVVWVNPTPWIAAADLTSRLEGSWGASAAERAELARFIAENGVHNLVMLSGDAHMLAIDDGGNNRYADPAGPPGFPVMHAAALDREGSVKGGPYSEGTFPGSGQYGLMRVTDDGGPSVIVDWSGWNAAGERIVGLRFTVPAGRD